MTDLATKGGEVKTNDDNDADDNNKSDDSDGICDNGVGRGEDGAPVINQTGEVGISVKDKKKT